MSKLYKKSFWAIVISSIVLIVAIYMQAIENNHLQSENAKFKNEIEYLLHENELLQEDNLNMQDRIWHYHDMKIRESAE